MKNSTTFRLCAVISLLFSLQSQSLYAQRDTSSVNSNLSTGPQNLIKASVTSVFLKTYVFQYERAIGKKTALGLGFSFMPKSGPPLKGKIEDLVDNQETWDHVKDYQSSNYAITPEFRYYFGKGVFQGFYVAPFMRFAKYQVDLPFEYSYTLPPDENTIHDTLPMAGSINTFTGGILFGAQWKLSKVVYLDWWILGPNYGTASGSLKGNKALNEQEQTALRQQLNDLGDIPLVDTKYTVTADGVKADIDGPWAGVRAGINVGFRF